MLRAGMLGSKFKEILGDTPASMQRLRAGIGLHMKHTTSWFQMDFHISVQYLDGEDEIRSPRILQHTFGPDVSVV